MKSLEEEFKELVSELEPWQKTDTRRMFYCGVLTGIACIRSGQGMAQIFEYLEQIERVLKYEDESRDSLQ